MSISSITPEEFPLITGVLFVRGTPLVFFLGYVYFAPGFIRGQSIGNPYRILTIKINHVHRIWTKIVKSPALNNEKTFWLFTNKKYLSFSAYPAYCGQLNLVQKSGNEIVYIFIFTRGAVSKWDIILVDGHFLKLFCR